MHGDASSLASGLTIGRCDWADTPLDGVFDHLMPAPLASGDHDLTEREKLPWMVVALESFVETLLDLFKPHHTKRSEQSKRDRLDVLLTSRSPAAQPANGRDGALVPHHCAGRSIPPLSAAVH